MDDGVGVTIGSGFLALACAAHASICALATSDAILADVSFAAVVAVSGNGSGSADVGAVTAGVTGVVEVAATAVPYFTVSYVTAMLEGWMLVGSTLADLARFEHGAVALEGLFAVVVGR